MKHIACIGECMIELNGKPFGSMTQAYGGDVFNTAAYIARMSQDKAVSYFVTSIGTDLLSDHLKSDWKKQGVNTDWVLRDDSKIPGLYQISLDDQGERSFQYWRCNSAAKWMLQHPQWSKLMSNMAGEVSAIYLSAITLAILSEADREALLSQLSQLKQSGITIIFDSNYRPKLWTDKFSAQTVYNQMLQVCDLALVTFDDEHDLWGDLMPVDSLTRMRELSSGVLIIKNGSEGACYFNEDNQIECVPALEQVKVVDTTSAGDAFNAGYISAWLQGLPISKSIKWGHQLAARVIGYSGALIPNSATDDLVQAFQKNISGQSS